MNRRDGFTLVELLVAAAVILLLAGLLLPTLMRAKEGQLLRNCRAEIEYLNTVLEQYKNDFGDYPPSRLVRLGAQAGLLNNEGNMALARHLATTRGNGPYLRSYMLANPDKLKVTSVVAAENDLSDPRSLEWAFMKPNDPRTIDDHYRELFDPWEMPYIYLHNRDYGSDKKDVYTVEGRTAAGGFESPSTVTAACKRDDNGTPIDGDYQQPYSFQLWSCGPNRTNDGGTGDDIVSW
ncbi:MAG TPA: prepilin-type N-terminal cleavage/methylation domain-containing protein [Planctomycetota bacterium]|nr:prepilin-type N-terminal cleavage/methylation domain-containing protein [Planctomycetota bacterium]